MFICIAILTIDIAALQKSRCSEIPNDQVKMRKNFLRQYEEADLKKKPILFIMSHYSITCGDSAV